VGTPAMPDYEVDAIFQMLLGLHLPLTVKLSENWNLTERITHGNA
jgi:hypothetical protein